MRLDEPKAGGILATLTRLAFGGKKRKTPADHRSLSR